jgi:hypothetical protein
MKTKTDSGRFKQKLLYTSIASVLLFSSSAQSAEIVINNNQVATITPAATDNITVQNGFSLTVAGLAVDIDAIAMGALTVDQGGSIISTLDGNSAIRIINAGGEIANGLINNGTIQATNPTNFIPTIQVNSNSKITGDIVNTGSIIALGDRSRGIRFETDTILDGSLNNSGLIQASREVIFFDDRTIINGDIINSGTIQATSGNDDGIVLEPDVVLNGSIINSGTITGFDTIGNAIDPTKIENGILIQDATVGAIINSGTINVDNRGIQLKNSSATAASITNTATGTIITERDPGIALTGADSAIAVTNHGTITSNQDPAIQTSLNISSAS